jgi:TonB family protein
MLALAIKSNVNFASISPRSNAISFRVSCALDGRSQVRSVNRGTKDFSLPANHFLTQHPPPCHPERSASKRSAAHAQSKAPFPFPSPTSPAGNFRHPAYLLSFRPLISMSGHPPSLKKQFSIILLAIFKPSRPRLAKSFLLVTAFISSAALGADKHAAPPCDKPREMVSQPRWSKEDQAKAKKMRAQGMVEISISEEGDVTESKVVRASSQEAVDLLLAYAKSAKFKPRAGCGVTHTAINYTLAGQ